MSDEYPKVVVVGGVTVTVADAAEEARWCKPALSGTTVTPLDVVPDVLDDPDGVPPDAVDPLDDVTIEMETPAYNEPAKPKKTATKKK